MSSYVGNIDGAVNYGNFSIFILCEGKRSGSQQQRGLDSFYDSRFQ